MAPRSERPYRRAPSGKRGDRTGHKGPRSRSLSRARGKAGTPPLPVDPAARPPIVAIVGRPNVGKSTLLNAFARSLVSIVEPTPGVTRDRVSVLCTMAGRTVELVDTGGLGIVDAQGLGPHVEAQIDAAVARAAVVLFVVDAREGVTPLDRAMADRLRKTKAPVLLLANKAETERVAWALGEMPVLGYGEPLPISAQEGNNLERVERLVGERMPEGPTTPPRLPPPVLSLAFVGRVNAGKSSLVNALVHEERMIVSEVPGTTRDSVDVRFERDGEAFVVIDTAGMRKERAVQGGLEFYAKRRSERALRRADVTALVLDATTDVARLDKEIAGLAAKEKRPILVVVNKWDLAPPGLSTEQFVDYLGKTLEGVAYAPVVFTSALSGKNVSRILDVARALRVQATTRVPTSQVTKAALAAYARRRPRPHGGKLGKVFYATQAEVDPPTIVLFVDDPARFEDPYRRYLENRFRESLPFPEVPIRISFRARDRSPSKNPAARDA
jgi:GTP-binding protein